MGRVKKNFQELRTGDWFTFCVDGRVCAGRCAGLEEPELFIYLLGVEDSWPIERLRAFRHEDAAAYSIVVAIRCRIPDDWTLVRREDVGQDFWPMRSFYVPDEGRSFEISYGSEEFSRDFEELGELSSVRGLSRWDPLRQWEDIQELALRGFRPEEDVALYLGGDLTEPEETSADEFLFRENSDCADFLIGLYAVSDPLRVVHDKLTAPLTDQEDLRVCADGEALAAISIVAKCWRKYSEYPVDSETIELLDVRWPPEVLRGAADRLTELESGPISETSPAALGRTVAFLRACMNDDSN